MIVKAAVNLALDYIRWTQLIPIVLAWAFAFAMVAGLMLIMFQSDIDSLIGWAGGLYESVFGPIPEAPEGEGEINITQDDAVPFVLKTWGWLALAGWIIGMIRSYFYGPLPERTLRSKIKIAGIATGICAAIVIVAYLSLGDTSKNRPIEMIISFTLPPLLLWGISIYSLTVSHLVNKLQKAVNRFGEKDDKEDKDLGVV